MRAVDQTTRNTATVNVIDGALAVTIIGGGGAGGTVTWDSIEDKPAVIAAGATQAEARTAIGAVALGTTGTTALAGNGTAAAATKLATARTLTTSLATWTAASFDGTGNASIGVTGVLGMANGGTGATTFAQARTNLGAGAVGDALFVSADVVAARTALGMSAIGNQLAPAPNETVARSAIGAVGLGTTASSAMAGNTFFATAPQADSTATDVAGLVADFNALLAKLRTGKFVQP